MKECILSIFALIMISFFPIDLMAEYAEASAREDILRRIDSAFNQGMKDYEQKADINTLYNSLTLCINALENDHQNYELLWRCARSAAQYAEGADGLQINGWKAICLEWGKKGSGFAAAAQTIEPERVEGYFWEVICVGKHADATGLVTAMKEGFYGKTKYCIEKAYEKDKSYLDYSPALLKSQFYFSVPWPLQDKERALEYFNEYETNTNWEWEGNKNRIVSAELLVSTKQNKYTGKAKQLVQEALDDNNLPKKYRNMAAKIMLDLNN